MPRIVVLASTCILALASDSQGGISIVNANHLNLPANTTVLQVPILMTGLPTDVVDFDMVNIQIYGPGFVPAPSIFPGNGIGDVGIATPTIDYLTSGGQNAGGDFTGNFMNGTSPVTPHTFLNNGGDDAWNLNDEQDLTTAGSNIPVTSNGGLLLTLVINFTGFGPGTVWTISMDENNGFGPISFGKVLPNDSEVPVPVDLSHSTFHVSLAPEPSSLALAAVGFLGLAAWGWRQRKR